MASIVGDCLSSRSEGERRGAELAVDLCAPRLVLWMTAVWSVCLATDMYFPETVFL